MGYRTAVSQNHQIRRNMRRSVNRGGWSNASCVVLFYIIAIKLPFVLPQFVVIAQLAQGETLQLLKDSMLVTVAAYEGK